MSPEIPQGVMPMGDFLSMLEGYGLTPVEIVNADGTGRRRKGYTDEQSYIEQKHIQRTEESHIEIPDDGFREEHVQGNTDTAS